MKRLLLIDLSGVFWAAWHATADQEVGAAFELTITRVRQLAQGYDYVACAIDCPPYFRKELHPEYKSQRDTPPENAVAQFRRVKARLEADGVLLWGVKGFEADDVIATACHLAPKTVLSKTTNPMNPDYEALVEVTVASNDKDLLQLVSAEVEVISTTNGEQYTTERVIEKWGVPPHMIGDLLALTGDPADNIPGVKGVGPKTAAALLKAWGDCDGVIANCDKLLPERFRVPVMQGAAGIRLARKLVELRRDVPIKWEELFEKREPQKLTEETMEDIDAEETQDTEPPPPVEVVGEPVAPKAEATKPDALAKIPGNGNGQALSFELGLQPGSLGAAYKLACGIHESRLYTRLPNPQAIWAIIIRGREMGLGALTALDSIQLVEGRPAPGAHLLISRAKQHPDCEYFAYTGGDETYAEYETKNRKSPRPTRLKYTIEQARKAGMVRQKSNWETRPAEMLRKTCAVQLARIEYPEALLGAYAAEELGA